MKPEIQGSIELRRGNITKENDDEYVDSLVNMIEGDIFGLMAYIMHIFPVLIFFAI